MSKRSFLSGMLLMLSFTAVVGQAVKTTAKPAAATSGYHIPITLSPYKNVQIYLGSYYGKSKTIVDSAVLNEQSKGIFKGIKKLTPGIYFVISPKYSILFEVLMDDKQHFSIESDTLKLDKTAIIGSVENDLFKTYSQFSITKGKELQQLSAQYSKATNKADSLRLQAELIKGNKVLQDYRNNFCKQHPNTLLATIFNAMKQPDAPAVPIVKGKPDSTYPYRFVKEHYWDDIGFNDDRLLRTPFFETKVDDYYKRLVVQHPDSLYKEIKYMLLMARTGKEMFPYLLTKFTNKYINPEIMGHDKVFLKIFEDFYAKGDTTYLNPASRKTISDRYYSLMANQLGNPAPELILTDTVGNSVSLYKIKSKYTFISFWDPTCGHCKEEIPRLDSIYKARWKKLGVTVFSVNANEAKMDEYKKFITDKKLSADWLFAYQTKAARDAEQKANVPNYRQLYDMYKTPTFYLLDENKRIIAKQLSIEQFNDLLSAKQNKPQ